MGRGKSRKITNYALVHTMDTMHWYILWTLCIGTYYGHYALLHTMDTKKTLQQKT